MYKVVVIKEELGKKHGQRATVQVYAFEDEIVGALGEALLQVTR